MIAGRLAAGLHLGLGLVSIGRTWGVAETAVPGEEQAAELLRAAITGGIRIFDTAPAYGASERRLGAFLKGLPPAAGADVVVMTKVGEHWDDQRGEAFVDHSFDAMARSLDRSMALLGRIDVLQLHKATEESIAAADTERLFRHADSLGIGAFGASVATVEAGWLALRGGLFNALQFPFNAGNRALEPLLSSLAAASRLPIINRPYAMGGLVHDAADKQAAGITAFGFQKAHVRNGVVLTGTGKAAHLAENIDAFRLAAAPASSGASIA